MVGVAPVCYFRALPVLIGLEKRADGAAEHEGNKGCKNVRREGSWMHHALKMRNAKTNRKREDEMTGAEGSKMVAVGGVLGTGAEIEDG